MKKVIVDTSFILSAIKYRADIKQGLQAMIDGPFEVIVPSPVITELKYLSKNKS